MSRVVGSAAADGSTGCGHRPAEVVTGEQAHGDAALDSTRTPRTPGTPASGANELADAVPGAPLVAAGGEARTEVDRDDPVRRP